MVGFLDFWKRITFSGNREAFPGLPLYETLLRFPKLGNPFFPSKNLSKVSEISPETYSGFRNQPGNLFGFSNARKPIFRGSRENDFYLECRAGSMSKIF